MKHVQHICQQQHAFGATLGAFSPQFVHRPPPQILTLSCTRWKTGRKLNIKVSVSNNPEPPQNLSEHLETGIQTVEKS